MSNVRVGIVGLGKIAQKVYLPFLSAEKGWTLAGAYSPSEIRRKTVCGVFRVNAFSSFSDLLDGSDAVFVNSSTDSHFEVVSEALKRGKDVYVDKPLASTSEAAEQLAELSLKCGRKLMVGFNRRFAPMYVRAKETCLHPSLIRLEKHRTDSVRAENFAVTLLDDYIHLIDTARWLAEPESRESIRGSITVGRSQELIFAQHSYRSNGVSVFMDMHRKAGTDLERMELIADGSVTRVKNLDTVEIETNGKTEISMPPSWDTILKRRGFEGAILHFINSVLGDTRPTPDGEEALKSQRMFDAIVAQSDYFSPAG